MRISIIDRVTPLIEKMNLKSGALRLLHKMIGQRAQACIKDHLIGLAQTRHDSASRLGATPSGHLGKAAEKVAMPTAIEQRANGVAIVLDHPGMSRAFHDVTIEPGPGKKFLTIPLVPEAYNQRARRIPGLQFITSGKGKKQDAFLGRPGKNGFFEAIYLLVPYVFQKQDRTLLPSDEQLLAAGVDGTRDFVNLLIAQKAP